MPTCSVAVLTSHHSPSGPDAMSLPTPLPSLDELTAAARGFEVPLRMRFRGVTVRRGLLLQGPSGWAEFAPFDDYDDVGASRWLSAAIEAGWGSFPAALRTSVPVNIIVPATSSALAAQMVTDAVRATGCTTVKVKVAEPGTDLQEDVARIAAVRAALDRALPDGTAARIRIDANGAWTPNQAITALPPLDDAAGGLEFVEQPCRSSEDCAEVRAKTVVRVAVDEGVRLAADLSDSALHERLRDAADVIVLKAIPLGGVSQALTLAEVIGLPAVVSGSLDTSVGIASGLALAAALPELLFACGLGTGLLLASDVTVPVVPRGGVLQPGRAEPHRDAVSAPEPAWLTRLSGAYRVLSAQR
jgi:o-succinylbenzoate synthase